ncbi:MAG: hypothetical protein NTU54_03075, partial [Candidatus Omnitrophica bacterium]|nr:hypothetical protein [Candidatus Omnitrophota bacterium]
ISVGGNWLNYGTTGTGLTPSVFIADNSTVILTGTGASNTITSGQTNSPFYNLTQSGTASTDTYTLQDPLVVSHTLTLTTGTLDTKSTGSYAITVGSANPVNGNFDQSSVNSKFVARSSLITLNGNGTFTADGTKDQTQYNAASLVLNGVNTLTYNNFTNYTANGFYNLTVGQSTHTTTLSSNFTVLNLLTVGSGTLTGGSAQVFLLGSTPLSFDAASVVSIYILWFNKAGSQTIPSLAKGYDCHIYLNATPQTVTQTGDVVLNGTRTLILTDSIAAAGSNTWKTDGYNLTVGGNLQIGRGSDTGLKKLDATKYGDGIPANGGRTSTISVGGNWINYGTTGTGLTPSQFIADNSTVILTGTGASNTITSGVSNSPFYNLTQNGSGGTYALQDALIVTNTLTLTNGTFSVGGKTLTLNGPAIAGTPANLSTTSSSSLVFGGSSSGVNIPSSVTALNNLTINNTNGVTLNSSPAISGTLTLTSGALGANGYNIGIAGDWTNNGGTFTYGSGTVTFNGAGAQAINGTSNSQTFNNLIIQKAAGTTLSVGGSTTSLTVNNLTETTGNFIAPATLNINGNLTITGGTFTAGANTNIKGGWSKAIAATFTPNSGTVTFTGTGASAISGSSAFYNLTCATAGKTLTFTADTAQTVTNSLTLTGTAANPIIINDTGAGAVPKLTVNSSATQSINNVSITNNDASGGIQLVARGTGSSLHGVVTNWALGSTGTTFTWTGLVSSDWNASGNWDLGLVPSSTDKVIMPSGTPNQPALTGSISFVNLDLNVSLDVGSYTLTISGNLTGSGTIQGVSPTLSVEGYIGIFNHPINMSVTGTPTIYAGSMFNNTSIALSGVKRPYNFPGAIPGFVFINGHLEDKIGQNTIRPVLNTGLNPLYRGTNNFIAPVPTMITVPMFMPMRGFGVMPMPAPVPAAIPLPAPVPVPIVVPIPSIAPAVHMPPVIAPEEFIGARTHSILPQIATSETFLGNIAEANLPEPLFRGIATSVNLPLPVTFEEFRGSLAGVNLPQPAIAPGFKGISSEGLLPPVIAPEEFIGARTHSILPQIATLETFLGNIAEVNLPEPLFRGIATSVNLPLPVIFEEFRGSLAGVNLPQPAIAPGFKGISLKTAIPIVESLVIKEIVPGTRVELMFPGGKNIIPTYGIGIPFGVEGPVMDTKIRLEKEKGKQER